ncbi:protein phosphatase 1 regulatory subunit 12A-like [Octopus sinensis]|uniref:Protein phosphatase 1 regulatory subunit 12A-like n=1 Tax=Octopus sinensis TaxID=2607531 RepID=A0A7E6FCM3_9MOLL|nr:protein phosphatase 1 regulatory subunit 12A-like [Octopus sinensis]
MADSHPKKTKNISTNPTFPASPSHDAPPHITVSPPPLATPPAKDSLPSTSSSSLKASSTTVTTEISTSARLATSRQSSSVDSSACTEKLTRSSSQNVSSVKQLPSVSTSLSGASTSFQTRTGTAPKPIAKPTSLSLYRPLENGGIGYSLNASKHFKEGDKKAKKGDKEDLNSKFKQKTRRWYSADQEPEYFTENETPEQTQHKTESESHKGTFNKSNSLEEGQQKRVLDRRGAFKFNKSKLKGGSQQRCNTKKEKDKMQKRKRKKINRYIGHLGSSNEGSDESEGFESSGREQKGTLNRLSNSFNLGLLGLGLGATRSSQKDEKKKKSSKKKKEDNENSWSFKRRKPKRSKSEGSNSSDGTDTDESSATTSESGYHKRKKGGIDQALRNTAIRSVTEMITAIQAIELPTVTPFDRREAVHRSESMTEREEIIVVVVR